MSFNKYMLDKINERQQSGLLRELTIYSEKNVDFSSNDYLGIAKKNHTGSTGSRLISGNNKSILELENYFSSLVNSESALFFGSGYQANVGLIPALADRNTTIFYDELIHASLRDGIRLSDGKSFSYKHNDLVHLESRLSKVQGKKMIVAESVYSMDGDSPDLDQLMELLITYDAELIIDEAHSFGIAGENGLGMVAGKQFSSKVLATIYPLGKAVGSSGCFIAGSNILKQYLINFCRSFIYSTAPSLTLVNEVSSQLNEVFISKNRIQLIEKKKYFLNHFKSENVLTGENSAIVSVQYADAEVLKNIEFLLFNKGIVVKAILYPTVAKGTERLRICFHSFNSIEEIDLLLTLLNKCN